MKKLNLSAIIAAGIMAMPGAALAQKFNSSYSISVYGLPIATSSFAGSIEGNKIAIDGNLRSSGLGRLVDSTKGSTQVRGIIDGSGVKPVSYVMSYVSGRKSSSVSIGFKKGSVFETVLQPKPKPRAPGWVPLSDAHLKDVVDPLTSTMVKADSLRSVCSRTLKIFDGEMRADLKLSGGPVTQFTTRGFKGKTITCNGRFIPIAGYRKGKSSIEYLRTRGKIRITYAPVGNSGVYAPVKASIGTKVGTVRVYATSFNVAN